MVRMRARTRTLVAWSLWLTTFGFCAAGLVVTLVVTRPLTAAVLADGAAFALVFPLGYATIGLVLGLRRPANPIGWLFAASGLVWSLTIPMDPWISQLILDHRPLPLAAQLGALVGEFNWAPAVALGITLPALLVPDGRLRSRRWRPVAAAAVAGPIMGLVGGSLIPGTAAGDRHPHRQPVRAGRGGRHGGGGGRLQRPGAVGGQHGGRAGLAGAAVPGLPWDRAPAAALGRRRRRRRRGRAAGRDGRCGGDLLRGAVRPGRGGGGGAALPAVGPGPPGQPDRHLRGGHRPAGPAVPADPARGHPPVRGVGQPRGGRRHPGRRRPVPAAAAPGPGRWSTGASTAAATTPPAPSRGSRSGCATSSTWTPWRASCWP